MPRRGHVPKREILPDPKYHDLQVAKLINNVMQHGKKGVAQRIVYEAFSQVQEKTEQDALEVFRKALENVMPMLEVKARRVGGSNYQVPIEVRPERRQALGLRWLINAARNRNERNMKDRLAAEIMDAANSTGAAYKRKEEMHRMAEANRAFAHFRW